MKLRFSILTPTNAGSPTYICNGVLNPATYTGLSMTIYNAGKLIYSVADLGGAVGIATDRYFKTNITGKEVRAHSLQKVGTLITLQIGDSLEDRLKAYEGIDITINIGVGSTTYNPFGNTFTIYGYDLGNDAGGGITDNPDFNIILTQIDYDPAPLTTLVLPYASLIAYRQPMTDRIHIYKNNSAPYSDISYSDSDGNLLLNAPNGYICEDEDIDILCSTSLSSGGVTTYACSQNTPVSVDAKTWIPEFNTQVSCVNNCSDECVTILSENEITVSLDFQNVDTVEIQDVAKYVITNVGINITIYNSSGQSVYNDRNVVYADIVGGILQINGIAVAGGVYTYTSSVFTPPVKGDYVIKTCIDYLGYEIATVKDDTTTVPVGYYKVLNSDFNNTTILPTVDFDSLHLGAAQNDMTDLFECNIAAAANSWGTNDDGILISIYVDSTPPLNNYFEIVDKHVTSDFSTICPHNAIGGAFYASAASVLLEPWDATTWGTLAPVVGRGNFTGGSITPILPVMSCCDTLAITACNWYEVEKEDCNAFVIKNMSLDDITYDIQEMGDNGTFTSIQTGTITALSELAVTHSTDGIYTYAVTRGTETLYYIIIVYCNLEECFRKVIKDLVCECNKDDCRESAYYDFNALVIQAFSYFSMLNHEYNFNYLYTAIDADKIAELYELHDFFERFEEYCLECSTKCINTKECN